MATGRASTDFVGADSDYIAIANQVNPSTSPYTVVCWFNWDGEITGASLSPICNWAGLNSATLNVQWSDDKVRIYEQGGQQGLSIAGINTGTWYFTAASYTGGAAGVSKLYLGSTANAVLQSTSAPYDNIDNRTDFFIAHYSIGQNIWFDGQVAYLQMFDSALSLEQITELQWSPFSANVNSHGTYTLWDSSSPVTDFSVEDLTGVVNGSPNASVEGPPVFLLGSN